MNNPPPQSEEEMFEAKRAELTEKVKKAKTKRHKFKWRYFVYLTIVILIIIASLGFFHKSSTDETILNRLVSASKNILPSNIGPLTPLITNPEEDLVGFQEDRINILLMGIGGKGHDGALLTDTIILASYKPSTSEVSMISIPRDMIVPIPKYGWRKINNVYALAEYEESSTGGDTAREQVGNIMGVDIPYYLVIDFKGFEEVIDLLGGIEVDVPRTLSDYEYPIPGRENDENGRYEHLLIEKGLQTFDGTTALKYVRSRHALGEEGSDFARAARQQLVIEAIKDKLLSFSTLLNPSKINKIIKNVDNNIDTNLTLNDMVGFGKVAKNFSDANNRVINKVLDSSPTGALQENNYNGAYVLEPKVTDFSELQFIAEHIFDPSANFVRPSDDKVQVPKVSLEDKTKNEEQATIEILNGTFVTGLASAHKQKLEDLGYSIVSVSNAPEQNYTKTIVYKNSTDPFPETTNFLTTNYASTDETLPDTIDSKADFVIVLGLDIAY